MTPEARLTEQLASDLAWTKCAAEEIRLRLMVAQMKIWNTKLALSRGVKLARARRQERDWAIERDEEHIRECMADQRLDRNRDGTVRCLDLRNEVLCRVAEDYDGMNEAARRYAACDWEGFVDQMRDVFDAAVRKVAECRLPYHLQD